MLIMQIKNPENSGGIIHFFGLVVEKGAQIIKKY
jgi:hypothetical protein